MYENTTLIAPEAEALICPTKKASAILYSVLISMDNTVGAASRRISFSTRSPVSFSYFSVSVIYSEK